MVQDLLHSLNALAGAASEGDRFALRDGVLTGFAASSGGRELLPLLRKAITAHVALCCQAREGRFTFGIEIGTDVAKLFGCLWPNAAQPEAVVDVKLRVTRLSEMRDPLAEYPAQVGALVSAFHHGETDPDFGWLIPPANIDFDQERGLLVGAPASQRDLTYLYGTQGARTAQRHDARLMPSSLRVLSGSEEGLLMFAAIVPPEHAGQPGTMAIEIGSGSTELILASTDGRKRTLAFAIAGDAQAGLDAIVRGIETNDIAPAVRYLETDPASAASFVAEAHKLRSAGGMLFMNPNRASGPFRRQSPHQPIEVAWARDYGSSNALDRYAPKAKILAVMAQAFGFNAIHQGRRGGLKRAMADFIGRAMTDT